MQFSISLIFHILNSLKYREIVVLLKTKNLELKYMLLNLRRGIYSKMLLKKINSLNKFMIGYLYLSDIFNYLAFTRKLESCILFIFCIIR